MLKRPTATEVRLPWLYAMTTAEVDEAKTAVANSQSEPLVRSLLPHPYVSFGPALMEGGYAAFAYRVETGLEGESPHAVVTAGAAYDNGRQVNDGVQPNPKGHDRYLDAAAYFRPPRLFSGQALFGFGWRWSELATTNYTKRADRPQVGIGYDYAHRPCPGCRRDFSMRVGMNWVMTGSDWRNGVHGPEMSFSMPSPRENRHWFWQQRLAVYRFHQTVTDQSNIPLMRSERADRGLLSVVDFAIRYRF